MKCPRCMRPIGPDDTICPSCNSILVVERKPTRPDEEKGWPLRHLASIMGRAGCALMIAQNALVLVGAAAFANSAVAFLSNPSQPADLGPVAGLVLVAGALDLVGLGLIAAALVALGAGANLLRRKDPFTEEEVKVPTQTAIFAMAAGLLVFAWALLTIIWRIAYPSGLGTSAAQLLANFAATGPQGAPPVLGAMMGVWILAVIILFAAALCLRIFVARLPSKIVSPRSMKPSSWVDFSIFSLVLTVGVAASPLAWIPWNGFQVVFFTFLATKLTVLPLLGLFAYWSLLLRFDAYGKLSLLVPVLKATPQEAAVVPAEARRAEPRRGPAVVAPPPSDDDMASIGRVK